MRKLVGYSGPPPFQIVVGYALLLLMAVWLAGCTSPKASIPTPATSTADTTSASGHVVLRGARGFAAAELAYITAADGVSRLARAGVIRGEMATRVRDWNRQARRLLVAGKATLDNAEKARIAADLFGIADRLNAVLGK